MLLFRLLRYTVVLYCMFELYVLTEKLRNSMCYQCVINLKIFLSSLCNLRDSQISWFWLLITGGRYIWIHGPGPPWASYLCLLRKYLNHVSPTDSFGVPEYLNIAQNSWVGDERSLPNQLKSVSIHTYWTQVRLQHRSIRSCRYLCAGTYYFPTSQPETVKAIALEFQAANHLVPNGKVPDFWIAQQPGASNIIWTLWWFKLHIDFVGSQLLSAIVHTSCAQPQKWVYRTFYTNQIPYNDV